LCTDRSATVSSIFAFSGYLIELRKVDEEYEAEKPMEVMGQLPVCVKVENGNRSIDASSFPFRLNQRVSAELPKICTTPQGNTGSFT
jgi:hypothetical protein